LDKKTNFFDRLEQFCSSQGIKNMRELADVLNYASAEKLYRLQRDVKNKPSFDIILDLTNKFDGINLNWLITGEGNMTNSTEVSNVFRLKTDNNVHGQVVPLYNIEASAGLVQLFQHSGDTKPIDYISIPNLPKCDGAVFIMGDSMYPLLKSGDIVMYKEIRNLQDGIFWGEMYLISVDLDGDEWVSVKWIQKSEKGEKYIKLVSQNQHHESKDIPLKRVRAIALIKASIRINSMR